MVKTIGYVFTAAFVGVASITAQAQSVMVSNLGSSPGPGYYVSSFPNTAAAFDTGSSATTLYSVTANVLAIFDVNTGHRDSAATYAATLFSNNNGAPGSPLTTIGTSFSPNVGYGLVDFVVSGTPYVLAANTQYWVVLNYNGTPIDYAGWDATAGNSVTGATGWNIPTIGYLLNSNPSYDFTPLFAVKATPVPEPSMMALIGLGVGSLLAIRRLRA